MNFPSFPIWFAMPMQLQCSLFSLLVPKARFCADTISLTWEGIWSSALWAKPCRTLFSQIAHLRVLLGIFLLRNFQMSMLFLQRSKCMVIVTQTPVEQCTIRTKCSLILQPVQQTYNICKKKSLFSSRACYLRVILIGIFTGLVLHS